MLVVRWVGAEVMEEDLEGVEWFSLEEVKGDSGMPLR